jgi:hypothetical protein
VKSNTIKRCRIKKAAHRGGLSLGRKRPREASTTSLLRCTNAFRAFLVPIHKRTLILILLFRQNRTSVRVGLPALTAAAAVSVAVSRSRASGSWLHPRRIGAPRRWKLRIRIKRLGDVEVPGAKSRAGMRLSEVASALCGPDLFQACRFQRRSPFQSCRVATLKP